MRPNPRSMVPACNAFRAGDCLESTNAYCVAPWAGPAPLEQLRRQLLHPPVLGELDPGALAGEPRGRLGAWGEAPGAGARLKAACWAAAAQVLGPACARPLCEPLYQRGNRCQRSAAEAPNPTDRPTLSGVRWAVQARPRRERNGLCARRPARAWRGRGRGDGDRSPGG
jgi:hypothetical protein